MPVQESEDAPMNLGDSGTIPIQNTEPDETNVQEEVLSPFFQGSVQDAIAQARNMQKVLVVALQGTNAI